jgi:hypothetical protein
MPSPRDPTRRNRNIGTAKQGHGQDNALVIPARKYPRPSAYFENVGRHATGWREIHGFRVAFLVEETRPECCHACTVDDVAHVLSFVPFADWQGIQLVVLRQPKRKEEILRPAWGRWVPNAEVGRHRGAAIFLDAVELARPLRWPLSLTPDDEKALERLRADGHAITTTRRHHRIALRLEAVRCTQLYHTLLHEIGHQVDSNRDPSAFARKCPDEKERFAHSYAEVMRQKLTAEGWVPFDRSLESPEGAR